MKKSIISVTPPCLAFSGHGEAAFGNTEINGANHQAWKQQAVEGDGVIYAFGGFFMSACILFFMVILFMRKW